MFVLYTVATVGADSEIGRASPNETYAKVCLAVTYFIPISVLSTRQQIL